MGYTALYRKYRPLTFDEVVGQHDVVETLKNKVLTGKIGHAILLTGSRGTGKTTLAKIFARAINCLNPQGANPCNECEVCRAILSETLMDVVEMDAASNNGVDDVRSINEKVKFPPSIARYKVFIVDEVHMMSKAAFNAFLKTLEEPPGYILFIFATTDPQAIPSTVMSRCQRFDLKRVSHGDIFMRLEKVCAMAGLEYTSDALELIVRRSDGAVRDALSILDKCSGFSTVIDKDAVVSAIGLVDDDVITSLSEAILDRDMEKALLAVNEVVSGGRSETYFLSDLQDHFRNLLMVMAGDSLSKLIVRSEWYVERLLELRTRTQFSRVVGIIEKLGDDVYRLKKSENTRITLETSIARLCLPPAMDDVDGLRERLEALEARISSGALVAAAAAPASARQPVQEVRAKAGADDQGIDDFSGIAGIVDALDDGMASVGAPDPEGHSGADIGDLAGSQEYLDTDKNIEVDLEHVVDQWDRILAVIGMRSKLTRNYLSSAKPSSVDGSVITIRFAAKDRSFCDSLSQPPRISDIESSIEEVLGKRLKVSLSVDAGDEGEEYDILSFFKGFEDKLIIE